MKKRVVIAMSGGVDSSVAAYLLKEEGYEVIGVTMQIWQDEKRCEIEDKGGCCGLSAVEDARKVASFLDIPYYVMNFKKEFKAHVIDYFIDEYFMGRTPNPCIACNRYVKWEALLHKSIALGADYIATGHYARIKRLPKGRYAVSASATAKKDQTYALYNLTQYQLAHTLMPAGDFTKDEIRRIAAEIGLNVADKPDSQEICFIPDHDYGAFLESNRPGIVQPGNFVDPEGNILGRHKGIVHYTVGQRKGLGIALGRPMFVKKIRPGENEVVLGDNNGVFSKELIAADVNLMSIESLGREGIKAFGKIRYSHKPALCTIRMEGDKLHCLFDEPQRAVTPGQAAVFYDGDGNVACGGTIQ